MNPAAQKIGHTLASILEQHQDQIAAAWAAAILCNAPARPGDHWAEMLLPSTQGGLQALIDTLNSGTYQALEEYLATLSAASLNSGFACGDTVQFMLMGKDACLAAIRQTEPPGSERAWALVSELDACLRWMTRYFVNVYNAETTHRHRSQRERRLSLLRSSLQRPESIRPDDILKQSAHSLITDLGVEWCDFYLVQDAPSLLLPVLGLGRLSTTSESVKLYPDYSFAPAVDSILSQVLEHRKPLACVDVGRDPRVNQALVRSAELKSLLALPLVAHNQVIAVALCGMLSEHREFTEEQIEIASEIGSDATLAIENIRLNEKWRLEYESLQRVMSSLLQELALEEVLQIVCFETQHLTSARGSAVYLVEEGPWLKLILSTGDRPSNEYLPVAGSLAGIVLQEGVSAIANHPVDDPRLHLPTKDVTNLLVVPLTVGGEKIGVLYAANKPQPFTPDDQRITSMLADQAAIAMEHARLMDRIRYLATLEERERLAREIHDNLAQSLSILKLQTSNALDLISNGQLEQAAARLQEMKKTASEAHIDAREAVFNLRNRSASTQGVAAALKDYLDQYRKSYGIGVRLEAQFTTEVTLPDATLIQVTRIIQEALTNIRKHARARTVHLRLKTDDGCLNITIEDDGQGFTPSQVHPSGAGGYGLQIMRERAESLGGHLEVDSQPGQGTRIILTVPLAERR